tara:strand:- start:47 stop:610 length:564 start_codon:yes stop_codon:yes gene_type:complete
MFEIGKKYYVNSIITDAIFANLHLPQKLKNTLLQLKKFGCNPVEVISIEDGIDQFVLQLKVRECYNSSSVPAIMSGGYCSGRGDRFFFENRDQADVIFTQGDVVQLMNLSGQTIQATQCVRLVYNNSNLFCMGVEDLNTVQDHQGLIGQALSATAPMQPCNVRLKKISQLMSLEMHNNLNIRGRGNI